MFYKNADFTHRAAQDQLRSIAALVSKLKASAWTIENVHTSKSIMLPVPTIKLPGLTFMLRDNFHDLNLLVVSDKEINLPLDFFYKQKDFSWYLEELDSKRNYSLRDWTDEELDDPRILRVKRKNGWSEMRGAEKDRWSVRMTSTEWYDNDWSSAKLLPVGPNPFSEETVFYRADGAFAEGIPIHAEPYAGPCKEFMNVMDSWEELTRVCEVVAVLSTSNRREKAFPAGPVTQ